MKRSNYDANRYNRQEIEEQVRKAIEKVYKDHEGVEIEFSLDPTVLKRPKEIVITFLISLNLCSTGPNIMYVEYIDNDGWRFCDCDEDYRREDCKQCFAYTMNIYYDICRVIRKYIKTNKDDIWSIKI